jgi:hypothetical protein
VRHEPTHTVSVFRGTTTDDFGDPMDDNTTPVKTGVLVSIGQRSRRVQAANDQTPRVVRHYTGYADPTEDIRRNDRLIDQSGRVYLVDNTDTSAPVSGFQPDLELELRS